MDKRVGRSTRWDIIISLIFLVFLFMFWQELYDFVTGKSTDKDAGQMAGAEVSGFERQLHEAHKYHKAGNRAEAHRIYGGLLRGLAAKPGISDEMAAVLQPAAEFYSEGNEIPPKQVEFLYLGALDAIRYVHGNTYTGMERMHRGLEDHYAKQGMHLLAASQARHLLRFYHRYYKDDLVRYPHTLSTALRLGKHMLAAGEPEEARTAFETALLLAEAHNQPTTDIKRLIALTNTDREPAEAAAP